ncbi:SNF2 helicase-like protein [Rhodospirillum rubrum F11]|uniref:SNF2 helicase-related protein n=3 Tax=Rhodospirillum rubrum TaxID=1085 RepID=Q2RXY2_RHORT|nr:DEAD/DEAH box helicase [Rhodospirillum rubrum]ABC21013.1 SNF2 helicase-related protein [Rhodospirillum rubrum ATCC 11170]AEO46678.1 SNF2 helicase-like protein [Rhodospirillum rubrum F11]MBK5952555.1 DEAD/DEAH box helicase [Rhodospirillum rubrum]QXG80709.1 SWIM zinc finger family protein [Rhodospirillum rubrum]HCF18215.1 DEAD/DEAH box helicase [Rhodospirillum rubrum]
MPGFLTADLIRARLAPKDFQRGEEYLKDGRVLKAEWVADDEISGQVAGSAGRRYVQTITLENGLGGLSIVGYCSCPVGFACKHVAAVLLTLAREAEPVVPAWDGSFGARPAQAAVSEPTLDPALAEWIAAVAGFEEVGDPEAYPPAIRHRLIYVVGPQGEGGVPQNGEGRSESRGGGRVSAEIEVTLWSIAVLKDGQMSSVERRILSADALVRSPARPAYLRPSDLALVPRLAALRAPGGGNALLLPQISGSELFAAMVASGRCRWGGPDGPTLYPGAARRAKLVWRSDGEGWQRPAIEPEAMAPEAADPETAQPDIGQPYIAQPAIPEIGALDGEAVEAPTRTDPDDASPAPEDGESGQSPEAEAWDLRALPIEPPAYVDPRSGETGPLDLGLDPRLAARLLSAPPIPPTSVDAVRSRLGALLPAAVPVLPAPIDAQPLSVAPQPILRLLALRAVPRMRGAEMPGETTQALVARPCFAYDSVILPADSSEPAPLRMVGASLMRIERDFAAEGTALRQLDRIGPLRVAEALGRVRVEGGISADRLIAPPFLPRGEERERAVDFLRDGVPDLEEAGWRIEIDPDFPVRPVVADSQDWWGGLNAVGGLEGTVGGWLSVGLGVTIDGERVDLLPALLTLLGEGEDLVEREEDELLYLPLGDGRVLPVAVRRLRPIFHALHAVAVPDERAGPGVRLSGRDLGPLALLEEAGKPLGVVWEGAEGARDIARRLAVVGLREAVAPPKGLVGSLRAYQNEGLDWLQFLRANNLGGILADDMGLGKTLQTLAHILVEKESGRLNDPVLIVAPTSVLGAWRREAAQFAPGLRLVVLHGPERAAGFSQMADQDVVVTSYALVRHDLEVLKAQPWHMLVLDEAQTIRNPQTVQYKAVAALKARHRLFLTGTPLENHLGDLWALMDLLMPGLLGDGATFRRVFRGPIEKRGDGPRRRALAVRVRPFILRRTKDEVATDLPAKTEMIDMVELEGGQRDLYEAVRLAAHKAIREVLAEKGLARGRIHILAALTRLRQVCCDPRLVKGGPRKPPPSAKLDRLEEMLRDLVDEGRRTLVFSAFPSMLALVEERLAAASIPWVSLTGETRDRDTPVTRFQSGAVPVFLISLKAGGTGLTLTAADTVIHYDPWWNPAVEAQATDRAHRIGQDKPVFVHKLVAAGTVEERILALQDRKRGLLDGLFDGEAGPSSLLSEEVIEEILRPLG